MRNLHDYFMLGVWAEGRAEKKKKRMGSILLELQGNRNTVKGGGGFNQWFCTVPCSFWQCERV